MKQLLIARHGYAESGSDDKQRPLSTRGLKTVPLMGEFLCRQNLNVEAIICSPAVRTLSTAHLLSQKLGLPTELISECASLYHATVDDLLTIIQQLNEEWSTVLFVGHNPSVTHTTNYLLTNPVHHFSPGSVAALEFTTTDRWFEINAHSGQLKFFASPNHFEK